MFGTLGGPELFLIFVVALIVFGPRKLPEIGKSLGRMMGEFRRASNEFRSTIESEVEAEKIREAMRIEPPAAPAPAGPYAPTTPPDAGTAPDATAPSEPGTEPVADVPSEPAPSEPVAAEPVPSEPAAAEPAGDTTRSEPVPETVSRRDDGSASERK